MKNQYSEEDMFAWTSCSVGDLKGDVITWPSSVDIPDHLISTNATLNEFCMDNEVLGLHILPIKLEFYDGILACKQGLT